MRFLRVPGRAFAAGLLVCSLLAPSRVHAADPLWPDAGDVNQHLEWEFTVPVKLKGMMNECKKAFIKVKVYDAAGAVLAERTDVVDLLGEAPGANFETTRVLKLNPDPGKNPFSAKKYTVDMTFDNGEIPSFNNPKIHYRAKDGTELVYHIEEEMPELAAADAGNLGGANAVQ